MRKDIRIIVLYESEVDSLVIFDELKKGGVEPVFKRVDNLTAMTAAFEEESWDLIISGYAGARYRALDALNILKTTKLDLPFIVIADGTRKNCDVEVMNVGAKDYLTIDNLSRLVPVIKREMSEIEIRTAHRRADETIRYKAYHDTLTRLPNRALFIDRLQQAMISENCGSLNISLMLLDLFKFKKANSILGHHYGDILLQQLAERLRQCCRRSDTVARMDGVEFAILMTDVDYTKTIYAAREILESVEKPFLINVNKYKMTACMGIAFFPEHGNNVDNLLCNADIALQMAKQNQGGFVLYSEEQQEQHSKSNFKSTRSSRGGFAKELFDAIKNNQLSLRYQPKMNIQTGRMCGVETLLRWKHPKHGYVSPEEFIPCAEETDLIQQFTLWVLEGALLQQRQWADQGMVLPVAVNLSMLNLMNPLCYESMLNIIHKYQLQPNVLEFELTETTMMADTVVALRKMEELSALGVNFSVDDFGTGYSSLTYLKRLPVKALKIDKSFVQDLTKDENDAVIVRATIDLAHNLELKVIAEGVEDRPTWDLLQILRCDIAQGYYISRPIHAHEIFDMYQWMESSNAHFVDLHTFE